MNQTQRNLWMGAWKSAVGVVTGALLTNIADPAYAIFSVAWWRHLGIACGVLLLTTEGRFWNQWANSGTERPLPAAISEAKDAAKATEDAISKVEQAAPKEAAPNDKR
jgi:hypothetical protein